MKKIVIIIKKVLFSILLLYTYNKIAVSFNLMIPINVITIGLLTFFDIPGIILLVIIYKMFYMG